MTRDSINEITENICSILLGSAKNTFGTYNNQKSEFEHDKPKHGDWFNADCKKI